jgi:RNA polymerase sigma-70 factor (ECF subfamily)
MVSEGRTRATLLERLRDAADTLAWDEFFHRYWRLIFALAKGRGCSDHTSEEIVQEVMVAVFDQRDVFQYDPARGRFRDWLSTVVRNKIAGIRRRPGEQVRKRETAWDGDPPATAWKARPTTSSDDGTPDAACEAAFEQALLATLLDIVRREVHPRTYQAFELFVLGELSGGEVARITGLSRNAVYQARKNVIRRLVELGAAYRGEEAMRPDLQAALRSRPSAAVERSIVTGTQSGRAGRGSSSMSASDVVAQEASSWPTWKKTPDPLPPGGSRK